MSKSGRKTQNKKTKNTAPQIKSQELSLSIEIGLIIIFVCSILLFISNFSLGGAIGEVISGFFFGVFGILQYILPIVFAIVCFFVIANRKDFLALLKILGLVFAIFFFCGFCTLVCHGDATLSPLECYQLSHDLRSDGGFIGSLFSLIFVKNIGLIGSYVVSVAGILICFILITEKSIYSFLKKSGKAVSERSKDLSEIEHSRRENRRVRREERQAAIDAVNDYEDAKLSRRERKASGVAFNTKIHEHEVITSDEMSELHSTVPYEDTISTTSTSEILEEKPQLKTIQEIKAEPEKIRSVTTPREKTSTKEKVAEPFLEEPKQEELSFEHNTSVDSSDYQFPPIQLLKKNESKVKGDNQKSLQETALKLEQTLRNFGVKVSVTDVSCGPSVTRFELQPEQGVKVSKIVALADDIKLNLAAADIRIEAPIPGKAAVGIEVPNKENVTVMLRDLFESSEFQTTKTKIPFTAGKDISGQVIISDIGKMPHVLIAGSTGSGKSVCINTIIMSILYKARPDEVKLIMIDPKVVELSVYNGIPHLMIPVVTESKKAAGALNWAVAEMTDRYQKFANANVREIKGYNEHVLSYNKEHPDTPLEKMPQIVIIVDELADLMMVAPGDVEDAICRLAQLARAAGIHLILATQRPSVNVITGLIKANMPSRVAFAVSSGVDSRTILDMNGAEKLLGKGDMLFHPQGYQKPLRVQGAFVSDQEVAAVVEFLKKHHTTTNQNELENEINEKVNALSLGGNTMTPGNAASTDDGRDVYFADAARFLIEKERGSIGMLQRMFKIGFNRAARIMDQLEEAGIVGPEEGTKPRKILVSLAEFESMLEDE